MKNRKQLFPSKMPEGCCPEYEKVWSRANERCHSIRMHCEDLWSDYWKHADDHFVKEFRLRFHQRWFEMYLTVTLIRAGLAIGDSHGNSGPDLLVLIDGQRLWIEAVCPENGESKKLDSVPKIQPNVAIHIPLDQYIFRLRSSLEEKSKKLKQYRQDNIISLDDLTAVAINIGGIPFLPAYMDGCIRRSIYGIDEFSAFVNRSRTKVGPIQREAPDFIAKSSGAPVSIQCFIDGSMDHISALLGSGVNAANLPGELGEDFILYPNLTSSQQWPYGILPLGREWRFSDSGEEWYGELMNPLSSEHLPGIATTT